MKRESFGKQERLLRKKDFDQVYRRGTRLHSKSFILMLYLNPGVNLSGHRRLGLTVSRKVGNSVVRNRFKRILREVFRRNKDLFPPGRDIVINVRKGVKRMSCRDVLMELQAILSKSTNH